MIEFVPGNHSYVSALQLKILTSYFCLTGHIFCYMNLLFRKVEEENMKISERGQITIPKALRERFGFHKDVAVEFIPTNDGILIQKSSRNKHPIDRVLGILNRPSDTDSYIEEVRGR